MVMSKWTLSSRQMLVLPPPLSPPPPPSLSLPPPLAAPTPIAAPEAPRALASLEPSGQGPHLIFPPDGATIRAPGFGPTGRGLTLAASGKALAWYVDGAPVGIDPVSREAVWRPAGPGFYRVTVVDGEGRKAQARVRVRP